MIEKLIRIKGWLCVNFICLILMAGIPQVNVWEYRWSTVAQAKKGMYNVIAVTPQLILFFLLSVALSFWMRTLNVWIDKEKTISSIPEN